MAIKSQVYVTGGWNGRRALHECEKYNEENDSWGYISPMATRRYGHMAVSFGSKIYVLGGQQVISHVTDRHVGKLTDVLSRLVY